MHLNRWYTKKYDLTDLCCPFYCFHFIFKYFQDPLEQSNSRTHEKEASVLIQIPNFKPSRNVPESFSFAALLFIKNAPAETVRNKCNDIERKKICLFLLKMMNGNKCSLSSSFELCVYNRNYF